MIYVRSSNPHAILSLAQTKPDSFGGVYVNDSDVHAAFQHGFYQIAPKEVDVPVVVSVPVDGFQVEVPPVVEEATEVVKDLIDDDEDLIDDAETVVSEPKPAPAPARKVKGA